MKKTTLIAALLDVCFCPLIPVYLPRWLLTCICSEFPLVINCKVFVACKGMVQHDVALGA
jgi:hypothetical protein